MAPVQLGHAARARAQGGRNLQQAWPSTIGRDDVDQDLEAQARQVGSNRLVPIAAHQEAAAHRIGQAQAQQQTRQHHAAPADQVARTAQAGLGAVQVAAGHHDVGVAIVHPSQQASDQPGVVLAVAVHDRQAPAARRVPAGDGGRGQAAAAFATDQSHTGIGAHVSLDDHGGQVVGGVVDDDDLVRHAGQFGSDLVQHAADGLVFVQRADDERDPWMSAMTERRVVRSLWSRKSRGCALRDHDPGRSFQRSVMISANSARCLLPSYLDLIRDVSVGKCSAPLDGKARG
jgi:hypothetical protein